ncbi:MAG: hypothetical protein ACOYWZ_21695 [Bacillota bacterium]
MFNKRTLKGVLTAVLILSTFTACRGLDGSNERQVIDKGDKKIVVLNPKETPVIDTEIKSSPSKQGITVGNMIVLKDVEAYDWRDEDTLMIRKKNYNAGEISVEGEPMAPTNLYLLDISSRKEELIRGEGRNQGGASYSKDRKYIFYKSNIEESADGYIMDSNGDKSVGITPEEGFIYSDEGRWIDNRHVIFKHYSSEGINKIYLAGIDENMKTTLTGLVEVNDIRASAIDKVDDKLYYIEKGALKVKDLGTNNIKILAENVRDIKVSPSKTQLAIIRDSEGEGNYLVVTDMEGVEKSMIAENVGAVEWSPDEKKIVYSSSLDNIEKPGLFVTDLKSGETLQVSIDQFSKVIWSPLGKKISATRLVKETDDYNWQTMVVTLSE